MRGQRRRVRWPAIRGARGLKPARDARHRVRRIPERAQYEREDAYAIIDAGWLAHVAFAVDGQPFVIPMLHARDGDRILLHGSVASRLMKTLGEGVPCSLAVTHVDGLVLARSHFHHSVNYRSAVAFGRAHLVADPAQKAAALARFVDAILPGRAADSRAADRKELGATSVLSFAIEDISAKIRAHGVKDDSDDLALPHWAGVVPMRVVHEAPQADQGCTAPIPHYVAALVAEHATPVS